MRPSTRLNTSSLQRSRLTAVLCRGVLNSEQEGNGPESMLEFIKACRGLPYRNGADQNVGLQAVRVLDAMYRSAASKKTEKAK